MPKRQTLSERESAFLGIVGGVGLSVLSVLAFQWVRRLNSRPQQDSPASDVSRQLLEAEISRLNTLIRINSMTTPDYDERQAYAVGGINGMSGTEIETMREVFNSFDRKNCGCVNVNELDKLQEELGEPLTKEELKCAMKDLDEDQNNEVTFEAFIHWWYTRHRNIHKDQKNRRGISFKLHSAQGLNEFECDRINTSAVGSGRQFRIKFLYEQKNGQLKQISPWHDIPLYSITPQVPLFNFICEIPKWTRRKYEIATGEYLNPIKQDVKNGKLRNYKHGDMMFNYGAFPQTWEDPAHIPEDTGFPGDNDPLDVLEIGSRQLKPGEVCSVKALGILAMIDSKETDWKVIAIRVADPLSSELNDIHDVDKHLPGAIRSIREYLRLYKCWTGAPENSFALNEDCLPRSYAHKVIEETHESWKRLRQQGKTVV